ncbi:MAG: alpha-L-fucosidase [Bacteroidales bacterium]|nr:alpha-L-fucosidase [Bacteroidales bacterium]
MKKYFCIILFAFVLLANNTVKAQQQQSFPQWFDSVKLGIMIHYGLYSVPSYSDREQYAEWFYKGFVTNDTLRQNFVKRVYGENFSYFDFTKYFKAELFNANQWVDLFKRSGAGYIVFSSKHHDGFCLWDTKTTNKNSMFAPSHRDFLKELKTACNSHNIRFGLYYSLMEWDNPIYRWTFDTAGIEKYVDKYLLPQFKELVDMYKPSLVFADGDWDFDYKTLRSEEMVKYLTDKVGKDEVIVNNRWGNGNPFGFLTPEYSAGINVKDHPWSECRSLARSFGLNRISPLEDYLSAEDLIKHFVQLVSMGGGLMLNVAPSADGQIPLIQQERLLQLGDWLSTNGEAIYGSKPWYKSNDFTEKEDYLYSKTLYFDWVRNAPVKNCSEDNFSISWTNTYIPKEDESLTFSLDVDDEAEIYISESGKQTYYGKATKDSVLEFTYDFKKDKTYSININYKEVDIDAHLSFLAKDNDKKTFAFKGDKDWKGKVTWRQPTKFYTTNNNNLYIIETQDLEKQLSVFLDEKPNKDMKITLLGSENIDLPWKYKNEILTIDLSALTMADVKSKYAYVFRLEDYLKK